MANYMSAVSATEAGRKTYASIKVEMKNGTSFTGLRKASQALRKVIMNHREDVEGMIKEISKTYSSAVAAPKIKEVKDSFDNDVKVKQEALTKLLDEITEGRRKSIQRYSMIPPSEETVRLINAYNGRDKDTVSDTEWSYLVSSVGNNYLAMRMVEGLAKKFDRQFILPFTPDDALKDLDKLDNIIDVSIQSIAIPDEEVANSNVLRFFNYDGEDGRPGDPFINELINVMDTSAGVIIMEEYKSVGKRLQEAKELALDNNNIKLATEIRLFMEANSLQLRDPDELKHDVFEEAEGLIQQAHSNTDSSD